MKITGADPLFVLPAKPATGLMPPEDDADVSEIELVVVRLHYAALITRHGPPPQTVAVRLEPLALPDRSGATYTARLQPGAPASARAWAQRFSEGLSSWSQAGFRDPVARQSPEPGDAGWSWTVGGYDEVVRDAAARLGREGRVHELRNLAAYLGDRLPDRLNPDTPFYTYARSPRA